MLIVSITLISCNDAGKSGGNGLKSSKTPTPTASDNFVLSGEIQE